MVSTGQKAPDFIAPAADQGTGTMLELFKLVETHDAIALIFQPAAFVPTGTAEFLAVQAAGWQTHDDLAVIGLTGDSLFSNAAYTNQYDLSFPLISDFHGNIAESYGLLLDEWEGHTNIPGRATVVIDSEWEIRAIETAEPLEKANPSPLEKVTTVIQSLDIPVENPELNYSGLTPD